MPRLRVLSGKEVIKILELFGFEIVSSKGSHVKLRRVSNGERQVLTWPNHKDLDKVTIRAIYNQASKYIHFEDLRRHFYRDH